MTELVLASASSRRADLLRQLGLSFSVVAPNIDESRLPGETPQDFVQRLALEKNVDVSERIKLPAVVVSADTIVVVGDHILGKPGSREEGLAMLFELSGRSHMVLTGVAISTCEHKHQFVVGTKVQFRTLSQGEAEAYWMIGEPVDKAGSYGIQDRGAIFVSSIEGSYSNVVGLPLMETAEVLKQLDIDCLA